MTPQHAANGHVEAEADDVGDFVRRKVNENPAKERLMKAYLAGIAEDGRLRVRIAIKENGQENEYLKGRLTTVDEIYGIPSSARVELRLPVEAVEGMTYATRIDSKKSGDAFAKIKHQVKVKLVDDDSVAEAIKLTQLAIDGALDGTW